MPASLSPHLLCMHKWFFAWLHKEPTIQIHVSALVHKKPREAPRWDNESSCMSLFVHLFVNFESIGLLDFTPDMLGQCFNRG